MTTMTRIGNRFEIPPLNTHDGLIGQGGMGAVYRGTDTMTQTPVAVKLLKSELLARDPDMVHRFEREGHALSKLNHPNIVKMLGAYEENGTHYLIMEYVPGGSLRDVLHQQPQLTVQRTLYTALDLADALTRAHRLEILHRDIKPDNVLIAEDGTPRLTDFGMARMGNSHITQDGAIVGTLAYLSPESFNGADPDPRTDIWSFGVMLYEMLAGERPYPHEQPGVLVNAIMTHPVPDLEAMRPDAPTGLVDLIYRMMKKDPDARIPSVRLVGAELEAIIQGGGNTTIQAVVSPDMDGRFENITPTPRPNLPTNKLDVPNNLPQQPTPFVGRTKEVSDIEKLLGSDDTRMITLLGPGGIGKTRIALEAAKTQLRTFKDGVYFVPLATEATRDIVPVTIGDTIGMSFGGGDARLELEDFLREKHMLLVLDNFETLTQCAAMMSGILKVAPGVKMLISSRERLRLRSEQIYDIEPMRVPGRYDTTADRLKDNAAVQLFVQSARRMMPDFELDDDNAADVATVVKQVQGLPLGIELAAAWLETLSVDEIVEEIEDSLDFLETDFQDVPERQRSLRAVFEYSWNKLSDAEKEVFLKLSVFRGGFEREAAKQVTGASLKVLTGLVNKSLLRREHTGRYFAHSVLKQYAEDLFDDDAARDEAYKNHAWYYTQFLDKLRPALDSDKEAAAYDAIDIEIENLRAAWSRGIEGQHWEEVSANVMLLIRYYAARGLMREGSEAMATLADALRDAGGQEMLYWRARLSEMYLRSSMGEYDLVLETSQVAFDYFTAQGCAIEAAMALNNISYVHTMRGDYEAARRSAIEADKNAEHSDYPMIKYKSKMALAYLDYLTGDYINALAIYEELLEESKKATMPVSIHANL
ncbi:MAG: protein kinase domain-containing protein [Aggregatilineales bacterium]